MKSVIFIMGVSLWTFQVQALELKTCQFNGTEGRPIFIQAAQPNSGGKSFILDRDVLTQSGRYREKDNLTLVDDPVASHLRLCSLKPSNPIAILVTNESSGTDLTKTIQISENNCVDIISRKVVVQKLTESSAPNFKPLPTSAYGKISGTSQPCLGHDGTYWSKIWWAIKGSLNTQPVFTPASGTGHISTPISHKSKYQPILFGNKDIKLRICTDTVGVVYRYASSSDISNEKEFTASLNCTTIIGASIYIDALKSPQKIIGGTYTLVDN
jgi:hypothetical protein